MNDLIFSTKDHLSNQKQEELFTPHPTYPKINQFENFNNTSNISTEHSLKEETKNFRGLNIKEDSEKEKYSNENSDEIIPLLKPEPITIKRSSFKICKNFLLSKKYEEQKINDKSTFSNLRVKSKKSNFKEIPFNAPTCNILKKCPEFDLDMDFNNHSNKNSVFQKKNCYINNFRNENSSLFPSNILQKSIDKNFECISDNEFFNNSKSFNFSKNYQSGKFNANINSNNNNNFLNNDNNYYIDLNEDKLNFQNFERRIFPGQINNYNSINFDNNLKNSSNCYFKSTNNQLEEIKLLNNKIHAKSDSTSKIKKCISKFFNKLNNNFNRQDYDLNDKEIYGTCSNSDNRILKICENTEIEFDSHIQTDFLNNNFSIKNLTNSNILNYEQHQREKNNQIGIQKETLFNINNFTNIYINMDNINNSNYSNTDLTKNSINHRININNEECNLELNDLEILSLKNNSNLDNKYIKPYKYILESSNKFICRDTTYSELFISDKSSNEKIFKKIFNVCELKICNNKVKKLSHGFFDIFNIELVEQIYKNDFKSLNLEQKFINSKKLIIEDNFFDNYYNRKSTKINEGIIIGNIQIIIKQLFNELIDIQKRYLTKASGYISRKQLLNCLKYISEINNLSEILTESQPFYFIIKEESDDQEEISNKKSNFFFSNDEEKEVKSNLTNQIVNKKDKYKKYKMKKIKYKNYSILHKINNKKNDLIIDNSEKYTNLLIDAHENKCNPLNLELNGSNQYEFIKNKKDLELLKNSINQNNSIKNNQIGLNNEMFKSNNNQESLSIINVGNNYNFYFNSVDKKSLNNKSDDLFKREKIIKQNIIPYTTLHQNKSNNLRTIFEDLNPDKSEIMLFSSKDDLRTLYNSKINCINTSENLNKNFKKKIIKKNLSEKKQINSINNVNKLIYKCDHCDAFYYTGQALGGHMSRTHPNLSVKYKMKKMVRDRRENQRNVLIEARRELLNKYNLYYEDMKYDKIKKQILKGFIRSHGLEFKEIVKKLKKMRKQK